MGFPGEELTAHEPLSEYERGRHAVLREVAKLPSPFNVFGPVMSCEWCEATWSGMDIDKAYHLIPPGRPMDRETLDRRSE